MTDQSIPMSIEKDPSNTTDDSSTQQGGKPERAAWRDLIYDALKEGKHAGVNAGTGCASKLRHVLEKGVYDASFGVAYGLAFGSIMAKESVVHPARDGRKKGAEAARNSAAARNQETDEAGFCSI